MALSLHVLPLIPKYIQLVVALTYSHGYTEKKSKPIHLTASTIFNMIVQDIAMKSRFTSSTLYLQKQRKILSQ